MYSTALKKSLVPMVGGDPLVLDDTPILNGNGHNKKHQMLVGMLNWIMTIGRLLTSVLQHHDWPDSLYATAKNLCSNKRSRYLGVSRNGQAGISWSNQRDPRTYLNCKAGFKKDYLRELQELYPDTYEKVDVNIFEPLIDEMAIVPLIWTMLMTRLHKICHSDDDLYQVNSDILLE